MSHSYREKAFGHDEIKPVSGGYSDVWGGVGMTLVDSLDTLYVMGMKENLLSKVRLCDGL